MHEIYVFSVQSVSPNLDDQALQAVSRRSRVILGTVSDHSRIGPVLRLQFQVFLVDEPLKWTTECFKFDRGHFNLLIEIIFFKTYYQAHMRNFKNSICYRSIFCYFVHHKRDISHFLVVSLPLYTVVFFPVLPHCAPPLWLPQGNCDRPSGSIFFASILYPVYLWFFHYQYIHACIHAHVLIVWTYSQRYVYMRYIYTYMCVSCVILMFCKIHIEAEVLSVRLPKEYDQINLAAKHPKLLCTYFIQNFIHIHTSIYACIHTHI